MKPIGIAFIALLVGCSGSKDEGSRDKGGELKEGDFIDEAKAPDLKKAIAAARSDIESKPLEELVVPFSVCPSADGLEQIRTKGNDASRAIADEAEAFCTFEGPMMLAERYAAVLEEKRSADPEAMLPYDCSGLTSALEKVTKPADQARVDKARAALDQHCAFMKR